MPTELVLERHDGRSIGSFHEVQGVISEIFPETRFYWTTSGPEKLKMAEERGIQFPPELHQSLTSLPSLLEGIYESGDAGAISFGLGFQEPVHRIYVTPLGWSDELELAIEHLANKIEGTCKINGDK